MHHIDANTPPGSPGLQVGLLNLQVQQNETPVRRGRRRVKGKNAKVYRDLSALQMQLDKATRKMEKYKKRCVRLSQELAGSPMQKNREAN